MTDTFSKLKSDLKKGYDLPKDEKAIEKIHCDLRAGNRVYWYYQDDLKFYEDEGESIKDYRDAIFSGIVVPKPYASGTRYIEYQDCVIVVDQYPTEKEDVEVDWITLGRLLDNKELVEVYDENE